MPSKRELDPKYTGIRSEMDRLWNQFVVQCEDMEEQAANGKPTLSATPEERIHSKVFYSGMASTAGRIRRSVDHPKYDPIHGNFFRMEPLSEKYKARAAECRREAEQYYNSVHAPQGQSLRYKIHMREASIWDEAAEMAIEGGD